jgi:hypothetical protein
MNPIQAPAWRKLVSQLKTLNVLSTNCYLNNPPLDACPFSVFKDLHNLPHEGINPHKLKNGKDVLETKMV